VSPILGGTAQTHMGMNIEVVTASQRLLALDRGRFLTSAVSPLINRIVFENPVAGCGEEL